MNMKKTSARLGAGTLALATVVAGLSFGPAAANAATVVTPAVAPLVLSANGSYWAVSNTLAVKAYSSAADAQKNAATFSIPGTDGGQLKLNGTNSCVQDTGQYTSVLATCNGSELAQKWYRTSTGRIARTVSGGSSLSINASALAVNRGTSGIVTLFSGAVTAVDVPARTATLAGLGAPGATMILNDTIPVPVGEDGKWSYTVTGLKLGKNTIKIEQYEGDNNKTNETSVVANLAVASIVAQSSFTAGDNTKPLVISGTAQAGANVEIWQGDKKLATVPAADVTGAFSADIAAPNAGGIQTYTVKQVLQNETAPDVKTVTADFGAQVSIVTPVNDQIHDGGALRFQGRGVVDGKVELREQGKQGVIGSATVLANGIWTIDTSLTGKKATYVATQTGKGNNVTTASVTLNPDGDMNPPVVNPVVPGSNHLIGSGGTPGDTIIVRDENGNEIGRDTVDADGNWDVTVPVTLGPGEHDLTIVEQNGDGDESDPTKVTVDFGAAVTATTAVANDKGIVTYTGTGQSGATVEVKGKSGRVLAGPVTVVDGKWTATATVALPAQAYTVDVFQATGIGVKSSAEISFEVKNTTPVAKAVTFTGPAANSTVNNPKPVFSGQGEVGATVIVRGSVRTVATTTVKGDGTWSVRSDIALDNGAYALVAVQTPTNGAPQSSATNPFVIQYKAAESLVVTSPEQDGTVQGPRPTFTGKGDVGATVTIKGATRTVATAVVQNDGTWTAPATVDLAKDVYNLTVSQDALNGDMEQTTVKFTVK